MTVAMKINEELNGIELYFNNKPESEVLSNLKSNGFRWSGFKKCWYTKQSEKAMQVAESLTNNLVIKEVATVKNTVKKATVKKQEINIWNATQWEDIQVNNKLGCKDIAKEVRAHVKNRFPNCKISVTSTYNKVDISIKSTPYEEGSVYLNSIREYCKNLLDAYNYCVSYDPYGDYGSTYNFYGRANIDWEYVQTAITEDIKKDMVNFDNELIKKQEADREKKLAEMEEWRLERESQQVEYKKQQEEEKKEIENIYNSVNVVNLDNNNEYFIIGSEFANLNKNATLDQYKEEIAKGDYYLQNVKVTKEIHFNDITVLNNFSSQLLTDFDFLNGTGGSFTEDKRINSMTDYDNMDRMERDSVEWYSYGVAVYYNNELQFVVDAQGHSYARYVGLTNNAKIEKKVEFKQVLTDKEVEELKQQATQLEDISVSVICDLEIYNTWENENWNEYKNTIKDKLSDIEFKLNKSIIQQLETENLKVSMYKLLTEVESIREQFEDANIQKGERVTLFYISDWGSIVSSRVTFDSVENVKYAQYNNAIRLSFTPENKRKLHYDYFYSTLLVYKGWVNLPDTVLNHVEESENMRITRSKYHSCDNRQYDEIMNYFDQKGIKAIVNTYKPQF